MCENGYGQRRRAGRCCGGEASPEPPDQQRGEDDRGGKGEEHDGVVGGEWVAGRGPDGQSDRTRADVGFGESERISCG